ncbi:MAG: nitroreductase [Acetobacteraceae bacterium]|nr:nitroreductase [Acetobacteraceae bacterium]MSP31095.1 nitroreductase [Acetobacteraceae bacterium]
MTDPAAIVDAAITTRRSVRAFLPTKVARATVEEILDVAARAPSGTNMQPWRVHAMAGGALKAFCDRVEGDFLAGGVGQQREYKYYPDEFFEPYLSRRRQVGFAMYDLLDIRRGETEKMKLQHARNFRFFDAPVGIICTIEKRLNVGSWLDYGFFLGNICAAARGRGLDTIPQAAFASLPDSVRAALGLTEQTGIVCGVAIGYADRDATVNQLCTPRAPASEFTHFTGFTG